MNGNGNKRKAPSGLSDQQIKVCERIILELFCNSFSAAFHEPVSKQIIKNPMDFKTIKTKLARSHFNHYNCMEDFLSDVKLVFQNCATYNQELSEVGKAGKNVRALFEELVAKFLPPYLKFASTYPPRPQPVSSNDWSTDPQKQTIDEIKYLAHTMINIGFQIQRDLACLSGDSIDMFKTRESAGRSIDTRNR